MLYRFGELTQVKAEHLIRHVHDGKNALALCSEGGDVYAALAIYDCLRTHDVSVTATGFVGSSAMLVLLGANKRKATPNTRFMVHPVSLDSNASEAALRERDFIHSTIRNILHERTHLNQIRAAYLMSQENIFGVQYAKDIGLL